MSNIDEIKNDPLAKLMIVKHAMEKMLSSDSISENDAVTVRSCSTVLDSIYSDISLIVALVENADSKGSTEK